MELLDNISSTEKPYPYEVLDRTNADRNNFFVPSPNIGNIYWLWKTENFIKTDAEMIIYFVFSNKRKHFDFFRI